MLVQQLHGSLNGARRVLSGNDFHSWNDPRASLTRFKFSIDRTDAWRAAARATLSARLGSVSPQCQQQTGRRGRGGGGGCTRDFDFAPPCPALFERGRDSAPAIYEPTRSTALPLDPRRALLPSSLPPGEPKTTTIAVTTCTTRWRGGRGCLTGNDIVITRRDPRERGALTGSPNRIIPLATPRGGGRTEEVHRFLGDTDSRARHELPTLAPSRSPLVTPLAVDICSRIIASVRLAADEYIIRDVFR